MLQRPELKLNFNKDNSIRTATRLCDKEILNLFGLIQSRDEINQFIFCTFKDLRDETE